MTLATSLRAVLRLVGQDRRWVGLAVALPLALAALGLGLLQPLLARHVIDSVGTGRSPWPGVALVVVVFASQALVGAGAVYLLSRTGEAVVLGTRVRLVERLVRLPIPTYHRYRIGDLISRVGTDTVALRQVVAEGITGAVTGTVGVIAVVGLMLWLDWVLAVVVAALIGIGLSAILPILRGIRAASAQGQQAVGEMAAGLERALGAIRMVRASRGEQRESQQITDRARAAYVAGVRMARLEAMIGPASEVAVTGSLLIALLVGGARVASGASSVGDLVAFVLYLFSLTVPVSALFQAVSATQQATGALQRIDQALALPPEPDHATVVETGGTPARVGPEPPVLELRDLWFGYRPQRPVLRGVCLSVPNRGHVALVGRSGAGKSTIFALIERFYEPDDGVIRFDGRDVRTMTRTEHRAAIGLVEQDCPILYGTLRDNLTYAHPEAGDDDIHRAIELANLADLVATLPRGLDTEVGERGVLLSGGERQRLAIARALLPRPRLLLFDEPTAHLDPANERALITAISQISGECALLVAGHRPSTVRATQHIVVLDHGTVVGVGSHGELLEANHHYRRMTASVPRPASGLPRSDPASALGDPDRLDAVASPGLREAP